MGVIQKAVSAALGSAATVKVATEALKRQEETKVKQAEKSQRDEKGMALAEAKLAVMQAREKRLQEKADKYKKTLENIDSNLQSPAPVDPVKPSQETPIGEQPTAIMDRRKRRRLARIKSTMARINALDESKRNLEIARAEKTYKRESLKGGRPE